jgi:hypothetical protein
MKAMYFSVSLVLVGGLYLTNVSNEGSIAAPIVEQQLRTLVQEQQQELSKKEEDTSALVNYNYFKDLVEEVGEYRQGHLIPLDDFLERSKQPNTVILDTRSKAMYDLKHIKGAIHLNFSDFTTAQLNELLAPYGGKDAEILIYCNNNFYDALAIEFNFQDDAFVSKSALPVELTIVEEEVSFNNEQTLALNIPTFINLYGYGYKNVFELNELVEVHDERIQFEGTFDDPISN